MFPQDYRAIGFCKSLASFKDKVAPQKEDLEKDAVSKIPGGVPDGSNFTMIAKCGESEKEEAKKSLAEAISAMENIATSSE